MHLQGGRMQVPFLYRIVPFHIFSGSWPTIFIAVTVSTPARRRLVGAQWSVENVGSILFKFRPNENA